MATLLPPYLFSISQQLFYILIKITIFSAQSCSPFHHSSAREVSSLTRILMIQTWLLAGERGSPPNNHFSRHLCFQASFKHTHRTWPVYMKIHTRISSGLKVKSCKARHAGYTKITLVRVVGGRDGKRGVFSFITLVEETKLLSSNCVSLRCHTQRIRNIWEICNIECRQKTAQNKGRTQASLLIDSVSFCSSLSTIPP